MSSSNSVTHEEPSTFESATTHQLSPTTPSHATQSESLLAPTEVQSNIPELSQDLTNFLHVLLPLLSDKEMSSEMKTPSDVVDYINKLPDEPGEVSRVSVIRIFFILIFCDELLNNLLYF